MQNLSAVHKGTSSVASKLAWLAVEPEPGEFVDG